MNIRLQPLSHQSSRTLAFSDLRRFYLPLGLTSLIMASSHWVISVGLTRMAEPEIALASYAVGMSTLSLFEMPAVMLRSTSLALVRKRSDASVVFRAGLMILALLVSVPAVLSFTPVLSLFYRRVLDVAPEVVRPAVTVFRILVILPLASGLRCFFQGLVIQERRTKFITLGMVLRLCVMALTIAALVRWRPDIGGAAGAITFLLGMWTEAAVAFWRGRKTQVLGSPVGDAAASPSEHTVRSVLTFLYPLLGTGMVSNLGRMLLNTGLAREGVGPGVLASFSVAWSLVWIFAAGVWGLNQTLLVFGDGSNRESPSGIVRFFVAMVAGCMLLIGLLSFTPLAEFALGRVMGTSEEMLPGAVRAMRWLILLPGIMAWQEWNIGKLLLRRCTTVLFLGKITNVLLVALSVGPGYRALLMLGAAGGSVATLLGHVGEGTVLAVASWLHSRRVSTDTLRMNVS